MVSGISRNRACLQGLGLSARCERRMTAAANRFGSRRSMWRKPVRPGGCLELQRSGEPERVKIQGVSAESLRKIGTERSGPASRNQKVWVLQACHGRLRGMPEERSASGSSTQVEAFSLDRLYVAKPAMDGEGRHFGREKVEIGAVQGVGRASTGLEVGFLQQRRWGSACVHGTAC